MLWCRAEPRPGRCGPGGGRREARPMPTETPTDPGRRLLRQVCRLLRRRIESGLPCRAEELLASYPVLAADPGHAVEVIVTEWTARAERGEPLDEADWLDRFPNYRLPLLRRLTDLRAAGAEERTRPDSGR